MFQNIGNPDLRTAFEKLLAHIIKRFWLLVAFVVVSMLVFAFCLYTTDKTYHHRNMELVNELTAVKAQLESVKSAEEKPSNATPEAQILTTEVPLREYVAPKEVVVPIEIGYNGYDDMFEYLEYGDTIEFVHPEQPDGLEVQFWFLYEGASFYKNIIMDPPHFRAVMESFPEYVTYAKEGYRATVVISGENVIEIKSIQDNNDTVVWTPDMVKAPRELNPLEEWGKLYAEVHGYDFLLKEFFDEVPECSTYRDTLGSCRNMYWSPAEEEARSEAFYRYATDPQNAVFVQIWGSVDACYRWVDAETPETVLQNVDQAADLWELPQSGWVALQIGNWTETGCQNSPTWETTATIKVEPGFVLGIDQMGYLYNTGPLGYAMFGNNMAYRTKEWEQNKIEKLLPDRFEMTE